MIRIYFDWNVISNLKRPEFREIKNFIGEHKDYLQFPYTPAHFSDLMKSYKPDNDLFKQDLKTIEYISENHFIFHEQNDTQYYFGPPNEYFNFTKNKKNVSMQINIESLLQEADQLSKEAGISKLGSFVRDIFKFIPNKVTFSDENKNLMNRVCPDLKLDNRNNLWEVIENFSQIAEKILTNKRYYKDYRNRLSNEGYQLKSNSGKWDHKQVLQNIDNFLSTSDFKTTFLELADASTIPIKGNKRFIDFYIAAYTLLDVIGYKRDKLPKSTDNFSNISIDGEHSFYGAHCDYHVTDDQNLRIKSKILYDKFNIKTKIIESSEFISELTKVIDKPDDQIGKLSDVVKFCTRKNYIGVLPNNEDGNSDCYFLKLPKYYFNFFNLAVYRYNNSGTLGVTFEKTVENLSDSIFYTETEKLIDILFKHFGYQESLNIEKVKQDFVHNHKNDRLKWSYGGVFIELTRNADTGFPSLSYFFDTEKIPALSTIIELLLLFKE